MRLLWEEGLQSCQLQLRGRAGVLSQPRARLWSLTGVGGAVGGEHGAALRAGCFPAFLKQPPKDDKKKKDAGKSAKKDKDPVNKSGGKAKKKVGVSSSKIKENWGRPFHIAVVIGDIQRMALTLWVIESDYSLNFKYTYKDCIYF